MSQTHSDTKNITVELTPGEVAEIRFSIVERRAYLVECIKASKQAGLNDAFESEWLNAVESVIAKLDGAA